MLDVPYIMFQWCNNVLLNESPHINFTAIAELTATEESRVAILLETPMDHLSTGFFFFFFAHPRYKEFEELLPIDVKCIY